MGTGDRTRVLTRGGAASPCEGLPQQPASRAGAYCRARFCACPAGRFSASRRDRARQMAARSDTHCLTQRPHTLQRGGWRSGLITTASGGRRARHLRSLYHAAWSPWAASRSWTFSLRQSLSYPTKCDITDDFRVRFSSRRSGRDATTPISPPKGAERRDGEVRPSTVASTRHANPARSGPTAPDLASRRQIIWDGRARTIRFEGARFEFLRAADRLSALPSKSRPDGAAEVGLPRARFRLSVRSRIQRDGALLLGARADLRPDRPGHLLLAPGLPRRGGNAPALRKWRLQCAHRRHCQPSRRRRSIPPFATVNGSVRERGMVSTTGRFDINPRWSFGWDVMAQSDK